MRDAMEINEEVAEEMGANAAALGAPMSVGVFAYDDLNVAYYAGYFNMKSYLVEMEKRAGTWRPN